MAVPLRNRELEDDRNFYYLGTTTRKQCEHYKKGIQCSGYLYKDTLSKVFCLECGLEPLVVH